MDADDGDGEYDVEAWRLLGEAAANRTAPDGDLPTRIAGLFQHPNADVRERAIAIGGLRWKHSAFFENFDKCLLIETDVDVLQTLMSAQVVSVEILETRRARVISFLERVESQEAGGRFSGLEAEANVLLRRMSGDLLSAEYARRAL
jgi:hypothetical protein